MILLIGGEAKISLSDFLDANTTRQDPDIDPLDIADITAIEALALNEVHYLPVHAGWLDVRRIA